MIRESNRHWLTWERDRAQRELQARSRILREVLFTLALVAGIVILWGLT